MQALADKHMHVHTLADKHMHMHALANKYMLMHMLVDTHICMHTLTGIQVFIYVYACVLGWACLPRPKESCAIFKNESGVYLR